MNTKNNITIVGGGLVGFSLALMLAQKGIACTLLESHSFPNNNKDVQNADVQNDSYISLDSRNTALSRKSVDIYSQLGLWDDLQSHAMPILEVNISEQGSFGKARLRAHEEKVESFGQATENRWLGKILLANARNNEHITLIDNATITKLTQNTAQAVISYNKDGKNQQIITDLVLACDGQHSFCRQALGITTRTKDYNQSAIVAVVETSKAHNQVAFERFSKQGPLALIPLAGKTATDQSRRSVVWIAKKGEEAQYLGTDNDRHFLNTLQHAYGHRAGQFLRVGKRGSYPLQQILAKKQVSGRVVLLGNSAHTLHPVAGQGFNLCLRDALAFTEQLSSHLNQHHSFTNSSTLQQTLSAYEKSRLTDQKRVITFCDSVVTGFGIQNPLVKFTRNAGLLAFDTIPGMKQLVANYAMGLKS